LFEHSVRRASGRSGGKSFAELFPQLFLIPLALVTVIVLVYLFFIASAKDTRTISEILRDIEVGGWHSRKQDAHALAERVRELSLAGASRYLSEEDTRHLLRIFQAAPPDDSLRASLVCALARGGDPAVTWDELRPLLEDDATPPEVRAQVIQGLSLSENRKAVAPLLATIEKRSSPQEWETRWYAIHAVVLILTRGESLAPEQLEKDELAQSALRSLRRAVGDSRREISWNTAYYLAQYFGDPAGTEVLEQLLDADYLDAQRGGEGETRELSASEKETWTVQAMAGLFRLRGAAMRPVLEAKKADPNPRVRDMALRCLRDLERGA
jgi:hypothetical protein